MAEIVRDGDRCQECGIGTARRMTVTNLRTGEVREIIKCRCPACKWSRPVRADDLKPESATPA